MARKMKGKAGEVGDKGICEFENNVDWWAPCAGPEKKQEEKEIEVK